MNPIVFDAPAWWQQPRWRIAVALALAISAAIWWTALTPVDNGPVRPHAASASLAVARPLPQPAEAIVPAAPGATAPANTARIPLAQPPQPLSTMIAPGVHITPLNVPPSTVPVPAGPSDHDSEPEN